MAANKNDKCCTKAMPVSIKHQFRTKYQCRRFKLLENLQRFTIELLTRFLVYFNSQFRGRLVTKIFP